MVLALLCTPASGSAQDLQDGKVVGFVNEQGKTIFLHDFKGKPTLVNLWATWCAPCVQEMPSLAKLQKEYAPKGLQVVAISEDGSMQDALNFYKKAKLLDLVPYYDQGHTVYVALGVQGLPTTILVNSYGQMVQRIEGPVDWDAPQVRVIVDGLVK
jgi:thiol-disulfide isomerase/thioredoxin